MAIAKNEIQIQWSSSNSTSVTAGSNATSDAFTFSSTLLPGGAGILLKADNNGTPASGDTVAFFILLTCGDPDGATTDEYATDEHTIPVVLDTNSVDPALKYIEIPAAAKGGKLYAENNAGTNAITVSACIQEITG